MRVVSDGLFTKKTSPLLNMDQILQMYDTPDESEPEDDDIVTSNGFAHTTPQTQQAPMIHPLVSSVPNVNI